MIPTTVQHVSTTHVHNVKKTLHKTNKTKYKYAHRREYLNYE